MRGDNITLSLFFVAKMRQYNYNSKMNIDIFTVIV